MSNAKLSSTLLFVLKERLMHIDIHDWRSVILLRGKQQIEK